MERQTPVSVGVVLRGGVTSTGVAGCIDYCSEDWGIPGSRPPVRPLGVRRVRASAHRFVDLPSRIESDLEWLGWAIDNVPFRNRAFLDPYVKNIGVGRGARHED